MKHFLAFCFLLLTTTLCAQDIIYKSSSDSIAAKVLSVGISEITYHKWENLDGPVYSLPISHIAAIRYANGTYDFFNQQPAADQTAENKPAASIALYRDGNTYIYGNLMMKKEETLNWLADQNCDAAYAQFSQGLQTANAGWALMATGLILDLTGSLISLRANDMVGKVMVGLGAAFEIACIPTIAVGYGKMHGSVSVYNATCVTAKTKPYWSIQASQNGIGLAYNF